MKQFREFVWPSNDPFSQGVGLGVLLTTIIWLVAIWTT